MGTYPVICLENSSNIPNWTRAFSWCGAITQLAAETSLCPLGTTRPPPEKGQGAGQQKGFEI